MRKNSLACFYGKSWLLVSACSLGVFAVQAADLPAVLEWSGRVELSMPVSGVVNTVAVQAGQLVKKGDLLASLDPALFKAGVAEARADMDRLTEEHADAKRDMDRVQELYARTVASTTELDAAKLRLARANAGLASSQARVERARRLLADTELRAPFDALVLLRHAEPGLVIASQCQPLPVLTVARADELIVRAQISSERAALLKLGDETEVLIGNVSLKGKVHALSADAGHRYNLDVVVQRQPGLLAGQTASVRLP